MAGGGLPPRSDKPSIKYRHSPLEGAFFEFPDIHREDCAPSSSDNNKQNGEKSEFKSHDILSTSELISTVGQIWNCATRPLSVFQPKTSSKHDSEDFQKGNMSRYSAEETNFRASTSAEDQYLSAHLLTKSHSSSMAQANVERLRLTEKMSFFESHSGSHIYPLFGRSLQGGSNIPVESCREKGLTSVGISYEFRNVYGWMNEITPSRLKSRSYSTKIGSKRTDEYTAEDISSTASCCMSDNTTCPAINLITGNGNVDCQTEMTKHYGSCSLQSAKSNMNTSASITSLCSDYFLELVQDMEANGSASRMPISRLHTDCLVNVLDSDTSAYESQEKTEEHDLRKRQKCQQNEFVVEGKSKVEIFSSTQEKPHYAFANQEHAFAGAFAGIFVSICLHPVDTVKTVIQSCRSDQKSIHCIGRSIISERGVTGLYRGIASNIASSAPISAVYTFTYESVKGALLPHFAKEYHSLAHCVAGGCASIATSFIFTPSERIKQQMQVGSHYQNCWKALIGIVRKGGFSSLYTGWGAVLCRNVPHSIIKFYTYESLKQLMLSSLQSNAQSNTLLTLVSGGVAGSTAALFTTPFDVVKTRLQTQIPGSINQYDGVFNTLKAIAKHEGLKGLYRGLTPRLVMYMTQGALFFASYESFKSILSPNSTQAQLNVPTIQCKQKVEDELTSLSVAA